MFSGVRSTDYTSGARAVVNNMNAATSAAMAATSDFGGIAETGMKAENLKAKTKYKTDSNEKIAKADVDTMVEIEKIKRESAEEVKNIMRPAKRMAGLLAAAGTVNSALYIDQIRKEEKAENDAYRAFLAEEDAKRQSMLEEYMNKESELEKVLKEQYGISLSEVAKIDQKRQTLGSENTSQLPGQSTGQEIAMNPTSLNIDLTKQAGGLTPLISTPGGKALASVIKAAEGTTGDAGYTTMFTGKKFTDLSKHPAMINRSGSLSSDAAGAYQFLSTTYNPVAQRLGLTDFSPESQEIAGRALVIGRGVDPDKIYETKEEFTQAMNKLAPEWAGLPYQGRSPKGFGMGYSYYGQGGKTVDQLFPIYQKALGRI